MKYDNKISNEGESNFNITCTTGKEGNFVCGCCNNQNNITTNFDVTSDHGRGNNNNN